MTHDENKISDLIDGGIVAKQEQQDKILEALIKKRFYNPYDVFNHPPEFYKCEDDRYLYKIHIVKWNTRSTRMTILYVRLDDKKQEYVFSKKMGIKRSPHGEKMR